MPTSALKYGSGYFQGWDRSRRLLWWTSPWTTGNQWLRWTNAGQCCPRRRRTWFPSSNTNATVIKFREPYNINAATLICTKHLSLHMAPHAAKTKHGVQLRNSSWKNQLTNTTPRKKLEANQERNARQRQRLNKVKASTRTTHKSTEIIKNKWGVCGWSLLYSTHKKKLARTHLTIFNISSNKKLRTWSPSLPSMYVERCQGEIHNLSNLRQPCIECTQVRAKEQCNWLSLIKTKRPSHLQIWNASQ